MNNASSQRPCVDELVERARQLRPELQKRAAQTEAEGRVSARTTQELSDAGLFDLFRPARFGGFEMPPSALVRVGFELGQACGSTAWCTTVANTCEWFTAYWPLETQTEIWGDRPRTMIAGSVAPTGLCRPAEGGYLLSGQWPFASNCDNSDWMIISAMMPTLEAGISAAGWFLVQTRDLAIDHASWQVSGLQGTGSKTVCAETPLFVPARRGIRFSDVLALTTPGNAIADNAMARFAFSTFGATCLVAPLLGMAQGALDWFVMAMQSKVRVPLRPGAPTSPTQSAHTQVRVGAASAAIDSAMALLLSDLARLESRIAAGGQLTITERVTTRRNAGFAARQAVEAVNLLYEGSGASSTSQSTAIQRFWRDINAGAKHVTLDVQAINALVGQERFGLPLAGQY